VHFSNGISIANLRIDKDITQQDIAKYLNITQRTYSKYETGESNIPLDVLCKIADYHKVSTDYILDRTDAKTHITKKQ
jgi:transcriptional regulator with XRE-family HTH domain